MNNRDHLIYAATFFLAICAMIVAAAQGWLI